MPNWANLAKIYTSMGAPMQPSPVDTAKIRSLIAGHDDNVLMLGATPAYADLGAQLTAIDATSAMLSKNWPGDTQRRRALLGNWVALPCCDGAFTAIIGDGSINSAAESLPKLFHETRRALAPKGVVALRTFCSPTPAETLETIAAGYFSAPDANPLCLRMRMAMAMAATEPGYVLAIRELACAFDRMFPDRAALAEKTGWNTLEIDRIDAMRDAPYGVCFPPRAYVRELAAQHFSHVEFIESEGYAMSERCPVVLLR